MSMKLASLVHEYDWSRTSFGAETEWPATLRSNVQLVLDQQIPMSLYWGDELTCLYNDAYCAMLGDKHPGALGAKGKEVWAEIWHILGPHVDAVLGGGTSTYHQDIALPMRRHGLLEETYFSFACSPLSDGDKVGGVLLSCQETTRVVYDRRELSTLRALCATAIGASAPQYACTEAMRVLGQNPDVPFALVYLIDGASAQVAAMQGLEGLPAGLTSLALNDEVWPFAQVTSTGFGQLTTALPLTVPMMHGLPTYGAVVAPLLLRRHLYGFLVTGVSPVRPLDDRYLAFHQQLADQLTTVIASAAAEEHRKLQSAEVHEARNQADSAVRVKDEFLAMLGHELRNPLAPILTALELMRLRGSSESEHERAVIERQVKHLVLLVDDLLDVSRLIRGKVTLDKEQLELGEVLDRAIEMSHPIIAERKHVLVEDFARTGLVVDADPIRLTQVFSNLINNAARYTPPGGTIHISAKQEGAELVATVRDNGIGIPTDMLGKVFDHFTQGQQSISRSGGGLGLGLAIVRSLMSLHGGTITAHSDGTGAGSEFVARMPASAVEVRPEVAVPVLPSKKVGFKVLVVDDNVDLAELLSESLAELGYVTQMAHDGVSALAAVEGFRPDVAVLDIGLPVMDGYELARRLRALPEFASLRLIALSGYGQDSDRQLAKLAGFDAHLVKPVDLTRLTAVIDES